MQAEVGQYLNSVQFLWGYFRGKKACAFLVLNSIAKKFYAVDIGFLALSILTSMLYIIFFQS